MVNFVLEDLKEALLNSGLYAAVRAMHGGIRQHNLNFFAMLELYNPTTCTFFTPSGELGFTLHEMYEVSGLMMRDIPYEYTPGTEELHIIRKQDPERDLLETLMPLPHLCSGYRATVRRC